MKDSNSCRRKLNSNENVYMEKGKASIILELIEELSDFVILSREKEVLVKTSQNMVLNYRMGKHGT